MLNVIYHGCVLRACQRLHISVASASAEFLHLRNITSRNRCVTLLGSSLRWAQECLKRLKEICTLHKRLHRYLHT
ncbi:hypothetical protein AAFF_G00151320 [Aldrovandia affinis]|uniref:Uncharacterized protein n=1 Tax=Aldrovandia affinis TaxID=143900 RepID=A0AAD7W837_9TELE|nr:hypothetical protein AAFF_G00151320 [Aldrovandia affinis]